MIESKIDCPLSSDTRIILFDTPYLRTGFTWEYYTKHECEKNCFVYISVHAYKIILIFMQLLLMAMLKFLAFLSIILSKRKMHFKIMCLYSCMYELYTWCIYMSSLMCIFIDVYVCIYTCTHIQTFRDGGKLILFKEASDVCFQNCVKTKL